MKTALACLILATAVLTSTAGAQTDSDWLVLVDRSDARVELEITSVVPGKNGGIQAVILTIYSTVQDNSRGGKFTRLLEQREWDCKKQLVWLHAISRAMGSEMLESYRVPNAASFQFLPELTLSGAISAEACSYFRKKGLL